METGLTEATPFLCALGRHRPEPLARWNEGYYFTRCARCGRDLVRTAYGRWHPPKGYRVVWQKQAPANAASAALVREPCSHRAASMAELPIQEVIRHVQNGDRAGAAPGGARSGTSHGSLDDLDSLATRAKPARVIGDFMNEATGDAAWESGSRRYAVQAAQQRATEDDRLAEIPDGASPEGPASPSPGPWGVRPLPAFAIPLALVLIALAVWAGSEMGRQMPVEAPTPRRQPLVANASLSAFVSAEILNCRSAPALDAILVDVLRRGDPVRLLAREGEWVSLASAGGQCWTLARYVSFAPPARDQQVY
jgi:hypothetical protein